MRFRRLPTEHAPSLRLANIDMAFVSAFMTLVGGAFLVKFAQSLHASDQWIAATAAIPSFMGILQVAGGMWGRRSPSYKRFVTPGWLLWRLLYVPIAALPILALSDSTKLATLAICLALAWGAVYIANPVFFDWIAELVPGNERGGFFSVRNAMSAAVAMVVGVLGGVAIDAFKGAGNEARGYSWIFGAGVALALVGQLFYSRMEDLPRANVVRENLRGSLSAAMRPLRDPQFRPVLLFLAMMVIGQSFAGNFFSAFAFECLKMPVKVLQFAVLTFSVGSIVTAPAWGRLADRYGNKPILTLTGLCVVLTPLPWLFCMPGRDLYNDVLMISTHFLMGAVWSGVGICQFNLLLATAKAEDRASYLGLGLALQAIVGGIAPMLGAPFLHALRPVGAAADVFAIAVAYKMLFGTTMGLRLLAVLFVFRVHEEGAERVGPALQDIRDQTKQAVGSLLRTKRGGD